MNGALPSSATMPIVRGVLFFSAATAISFASAGLRAPAQTRTEIRPKVTVSDECTAFAWAPDGRVVYSTKHVVETKKLDIERDEIWILGKDEQPRKIFSGERLNREGVAFSYTITGLRWSPDGTRLTAALHVSQFPTMRGDEQDSQLLLGLDQDGRELKIEKGDSTIGRAVDGTWLADHETIAYTTIAGRGNPLFTLHLLRPRLQRGTDIFIGHTFATVAWGAKLNAAVAVERTNAFDSPARITSLDLLHEDGRALATLESYAGGMSISPASDRIAYFLDADTLEIRDVAEPERTARIHCNSGEICWSPDGTKLLIKQGQERREGDLVWVNVPPLTTSDQSESQTQAADPKPFLTGVLFRQAAISPDGKVVAVIEAGNRHLLLYDAPQ